MWGTTDQARQIWNAGVSKHPAVIARCSGVADVIVAVNFARCEKSAGCYSWRPQRLSGKFDRFASEPLPTIIPSLFYGA
jgi:hypothetical protein